MRLDPLTLNDYEQIARLRLSTDSWEYIRGGEIDEATVARNDASFDDLLLRPRHLRGADQPELATTLLGTSVGLPVFLSPSAGHRTAHPDGELATVAGAAAAGALMIASTETNETIGAIAGAGDAPLWFALHHLTRSVTEYLANAARAAGCLAIVVGVDDPLPHPKHVDIRSRYRAPQPYGNLDGFAAPAVDASWAGHREQPLTWSDIAWIHEVSGLPLVVKGIMTAADARLARDAGASAVLVSNQGGRHLDGTFSTIEALPEVVAAVGADVEVYLDGGIRRGTDVLKALALGARAVGIGRPVLWGLASDGAAGVAGVLDVLRQELRLAAAYSGVANITSVDGDVVAVPARWADWLTAGELLEARRRRAAL